MLVPIICLILYLQASTYARSIDSVSLDELVKAGLKQNRPVVIVLDPSKSLKLPDIENDGADERVEDVGEDKTLRNSWNQDRRGGVESCKQLLREMLEGKCNDQAKCTEVVWEVANKICDGDNKEA